MSVNLDFENDDDDGSKRREAALETRLVKPFAIWYYGGDRPDWHLQCVDGMSTLLLGDSYLKRGFGMILKMIILFLFARGRLL